MHVAGRLCETLCCNSVASRSAHTDQLGINIFNPSPQSSPQTPHLEEDEGSGGGESSQYLSNGSND